MLQHFWWGSVFLLAVPVMVLLLLLGPVLLPEFRDPEAGRLDLISAAMSLAGVLLVIYGLKRLAQDGVALPQVLSILTGLAIGLWTLPWSAAFIVGSNLTPPIARRIPPEVVVAAGLVLTAVGLGILTQIDRPSGLGVLVAGSVVYSLGLAPVITLATDLIVGSAPPERAGAAPAPPQ